jgi:hypothetical protein
LVNFAAIPSSIETDKRRLKKLNLSPNCLTRALPASTSAKNEKEERKRRTENFGTADDSEGNAQRLPFHTACSDVSALPACGN